MTRKTHDEIQNLKRRKLQLSTDIESLAASADQLAQKAEGSRAISILVKSNAIRQASKEMVIEMTELDKKLADKLLERKNWISRGLVVTVMYSVNSCCISLTFFYSTLQTFTVSIWITNKLMTDVCHLLSVLFLWRYEPVRRTGKSDDWLTMFFARIIRFTVQKFQLFWVIFCIIIFFIELWHILILWLAKMPNGGMPVFTLIATGWRYQKIFFYKKNTACFYHYGIGEYSTVHFMSHCSLNFECPRLGYGFLSIILVLEKCNLGPWKSLKSAWIL